MPGRLKVNLITKAAVKVIKSG